ncbi:B-cell receptor CD22-like [Betta splendens]|uniref:B-cell receptor CD22-like n=1 Tax=Betta splendens TaxID=158456 RepID=A0A8M1H5R5_BETSP|nr:B-cell receptor CD22-like [Betta splendens]
MEALILMILLITPGVWSRNWGVTFEDQCALTGTSIVLKCEYDYPYGHEVTSENWYIARPVYGQYRLYSISSEFKYIGDKNGDCSLEIHNVKRSYEGRYYFRFETKTNRWTSKRYAYLSVKELTAVVEPSTVTEGDNVTLTCFTGCPTPTTIVWLKDGRPAPGPSLNVRREDAGSYYCAVSGQEAARSAPAALKVLYAPIDVTLTVHPSPDDIMTESSVTMTCSSDANPPVTHSEYMLYKDGQLVSTGQRHSIPAIQPSHSGVYHCQASNSISRNGLHLMNSTTVHVDVQYRPMNIVVSVDPPHVAAGSPVNLTCSCAANPAADNYTWYKRSNAAGASSLVRVASGRVMSLPSMTSSHIGLYVCQASNSRGDSHSAEVLLSVAEREGTQSVPVLAVVGVSLFVTFLVAVIMFWKWRSRAKKKKSVTDVKLSGRDSSSLANEDESVYANIHMFPSSPSPKTTAQNMTSASDTNSTCDHDDYTLCKDEVTYSTVTIKPKNQSLSHYNSRAPQTSCAKEENDVTVIYATVVQSS